MLPASPPGIHVIRAAHAPAAVVFRRGPGRWWHISRWHLDTGDIEGGAWLYGTLYPRRCDLSPDGELLYYFALRMSRKEFLGVSGLQTYSAVSKAPWLFALAAWRELGTWTRGYHFVEGALEEDEVSIGVPQHGDLGPMKRYRLARTDPRQYDNERRRGWVEHELCPPHKPSDVWDEARSVILAKPSPDGKRRLVLQDQEWISGVPGRIEGRSPLFRLEKGRRITELPDAVWADWDSVGRLLVATREGKLQIHNLESGKLLREAAIAPLRPVPRAAPAWAQSW
jgi:hypothetical protein